MQQRRVPRHQAAPVVTDEIEFLTAKRGRDAGHVGRQLADVVGAHVERFTATAVATLIGHRHAISGGGKGCNLMAPQIPALRPAVQQDD